MAFSSAVTQFQVWKYQPQSYAPISSPLAAWMQKAYKGFFAEDSKKTGVYYLLDFSHSKNPLTPFNADRGHPFKFKNMLLLADNFIQAITKNDVNAAKKILTEGLPYLLSCQGALPESDGHLAGAKKQLSEIIEIFQTMFPPRDEKLIDQQTGLIDQKGINLYCSASEHSIHNNLMIRLAAYQTERKQRFFGGAGAVRATGAINREYAINSLISSLLLHAQDEKDSQDIANMIALMKELYPSGGSSLFWGHTTLTSILVEIERDLKLPTQNLLPSKTSPTPAGAAGRA